MYHLWDSWVRKPRHIGRCPGVRVYLWHQAPEYLQTYTQLRTKHLEPRDREKPDGCLSTTKAWIWLYDEREALPRRRCSERQRQVLRNAWAAAQTHYTCKRCGKKPTNLADLHHHFRKGSCEDCLQLTKWEAEVQACEDQLRRDGNEAILWARAMLARQDWAVIDTETTSLDGVVVEICAVAPDGTILFESLVKPDRPVTHGARAVHGISDEALAVVPDLKAVLSRSARAAGLAELSHQWECLKLAYAQYCGDWSDYWHSYRWQPHPGAGHRAKEDALGALALLQQMAATDLDESSEGC